MKKRVNYITIAVLAFYIGVPLMILGANYIKFTNEQDELRQMLRKGNLENADIKTVYITGEDIDKEQMYVTNDIKSSENIFTLYRYIIEDIHQDGNTLHLKLKIHPRYDAQKCNFLDCIFIKTLEKVFINGEERQDGTHIVEPKDQGGPVILDY